jgi:hypothetical protein
MIRREWRRAGRREQWLDEFEITALPAILAGNDWNFFVTFHEFRF